MTDYSDLFDQAFSAELLASDYAVQLNGELEDFDAFAMPSFVPLPADAVCVICVVPRRAKGGE